MKKSCPECGTKFKNLGNHWHSSESCDYPKLSDKQREVAKGLLMGDGNVNIRENGNPKLRANMIKKEYLEYLDDLFGVMGAGVKLVRTAEESATQCRERGFRPNARKENYSDVYKWRTRSSPEFNEFEEWYSSGEKVWPEDIELTPTVLKHWYCCDGYWYNKGSNNRVEIASSNEGDNEKKINKIFEDTEIGKPSHYQRYEENNGHTTCNIRFTVSQTQKFFNYMGEPLPGFEYKWPSEETS